MALCGGARVGGILLRRPVREDRNLLSEGLEALNFLEGLGGSCAGAGNMSLLSVLASREVRFNACFLLGGGKLRRFSSPPSLGKILWISSLKLFKVSNSSFSDFELSRFNSNTSSR